MNYGLSYAQPCWDWNSITNFVLMRAPRDEIKVLKADIGLPVLEGFQPATGTPRGQRADWRFTLPDCKDIHVVEFDDHYLVHWDEVAPSCDPVEHLRRDAPNWYRVGTTAAGAGIGAAIGGKKGAVVGGLIGLLVGVFTS